MTVENLSRPWQIYNIEKIHLQTDCHSILSTHGFFNMNYRYVSDNVWRRARDDAPIACKWNILNFLMGLRSHVSFFVQFINNAI